MPCPEKRLEFVILWGELPSTHPTRVIVFLHKPDNLSLRHDAPRKLSIRVGHFGNQGRQYRHRLCIQTAAVALDILGVDTLSLFLR